MSKKLAVVTITPVLYRPGLGPQLLQCRPETPITNELFPPNAIAMLVLLLGETHHSHTMDVRISAGRKRQRRSKGQRKEVSLVLD